MASACTQCLSCSHCYQEPTCQRYAAFAYLSTSSASPRWKPAWTMATRSSDGLTLPTSGPWGAGPPTLDLSLTFLWSLHTLVIQGGGGIKENLKISLDHFFQPLLLLALPACNDNLQTDVTRYSWEWHGSKRNLGFGKVLLVRRRHTQRQRGFLTCGSGDWKVQGATGRQSALARAAYTGLSYSSYSSSLLLAPASPANNPNPPNSTSMCSKFCGIDAKKMLKSRPDEEHLYSQQQQQFTPSGVCRHVGATVSILVYWEPDLYFWYLHNYKYKYKSHSRAICCYCRHLGADSILLYWEPLPKTSNWHNKCRSNPKICCNLTTTSLFWPLKVRIILGPGP